MNPVLGVVQGLDGLAGCHPKDCSCGCCVVGACCFLGGAAAVVAVAVNSNKGDTTVAEPCKQLDPIACEGDPLCSPGSSGTCLPKVTTRTGEVECTTSTN